MNKVLDKVKNISGDCCVTILLNTHRTLPDNEKDPLVLKNLIKEASNRLPKECDPKFSTILVDKLNHLAEHIDHRHNLESLALFVSDKIEEYTRLPLMVENRVTIGKTFAIRDIVRALHKEKEYYVLVLSRDEARLIKAFNDKVINEAEGPFPVKNNSHHPKQRSEAAIGNRKTNLQLEFFNIVDKKLVEVLKEDPARVLICTDEPNYHQYMQITDRPEMILGNLNGNRINDKAYHIVSEAWPYILQIRREDLEARKAELKSAENTGKIVSDFNDVWRTIKEGGGKTLFVQRDYFQPARISNGTIEPVSATQAGQAEVVDDIIDDMIEVNLKNGGDCVFLSPDAMEKYRGLALTTRY